MALIECPKCKGKVSDSADVCVHCGFNLLEENRKIKKMYTCIVDGKEIDFSGIYRKFGFNYDDPSFDWRGYKQSFERIFPGKDDFWEFQDLIRKNKFPKTFNRKRH